MGITEDAIKEIKQRKKEIIAKFADPFIYLPIENPFTIFMAGSPGAGKTEFSNKFDPRLYDYDSAVPIVRIDADEIRKMISFFNGTNSDEVQLAATIGMEKLFDHIQAHNQNAIVDTTFSDYHKAYDNVKRAFKHERKVGLFYIHLDPRVAWAYTKLRQEKEGRSVTKDFFVDSYLRAKENVDKIKQDFPRIEVNVIEKELTGSEDDPIRLKTKMNVDRVDNHLKMVYNRDDLESLILL